MNNNNSLYLAIGIGVAAAAGIYVAVKVGQRKRSIWVRAYRRAEDLTSQATRWLTTATELLDKGREGAERRRKAVVKAIDAGKYAYGKSVA